MLSFFSTFISGTKEIVQKELLNLFPDVEIAQNFDGLIVYRTNQPREKIKDLQFFNNSYLLLKQFNKATFIKDLINDVLNSDFQIPKDNYSKDQTFRFIVSQENQTQKINRDLLMQLENKVITQTNLQVNRAKPDIEFVISLRSEGFGFLGLRLTYHPLKSLQKGQLRPELAHLLILLSEPSNEDIFLDPFSGYGSIPNELLNFPHQKIIQSDINPQSESIQKSDAANLKNITDQSIDKIVTDPPWGIFDLAINLEDLYPKMLQEFHRILKPNGVLILLIGQKEIFENILKDFTAKFKLAEKYNILVSGKKASIYKLTKV